MPLNLNKTLQSGVVAGFFKLERLNFNALKGTAIVTINLYLNKAAFQAGSAPVDQYQFDLPIDITTFNAVMNAVETQLKAQTFFSGAQDA